MDDLRSAIGLTHSGAVRLVDRLAESGLVERRPGQDGRSVAVMLTPRGRRVAERTMAARAAVIDELLDRLGPAERAALVPLLERLVGAVTERRLAARVAGRPPSGGWLCRLCDFDACGRPAGRCPAPTDRLWRPAHAGAMSDVRPSAAHRSSPDRAPASSTFGAR